VAAIARVAGSALQLGLETAISLALGLAIGAIASIRARLLPGATLAAQYALRAGITLLGARLTLGQLLGTGAGSVLAITLTVSLALLLGTWLARRLRLVPPLSALITVGMAICGNSAILALAPIIRAPHRETAYAVSTITIFGLIGVLLLPVLGRLVGLPDATFGMWSGLAVNDTAQVVATGYAFSPAAGDVATVVKLTRNLAILPVLLGATWWAARTLDAEAGAPARSTLDLVARAVPWFVVGFVIVALLRSVGALDGRLPGGGTLADACSIGATLLILVALAGVGLAADVRSLLRVGARPFLLAGAIWVSIGSLSLMLARVYHGT
jgi:uncharacterized integral membrane protein (TIGR00698 family)